MSKEIGIEIPIPSLKVLIILGNLAVHIDEYLSPTGHPVDEVVIRDLLQDPELVEWLAKMSDLTLLPVKR